MKKGKKRGYIVDYIGLTENLTEALTLYAAADEAQELAVDLTYRLAKKAYRL